MVNRVSEYGAEARAGVDLAVRFIGHPPVIGQGGGSSNCKIKSNGPLKKWGRRGIASTPSALAFPVPPVILTCGP